MPFNTLVGAINMSAQQRTILNHLVTRGTISPAEAFITHGISRLSSVIHRLRLAGYKIDMSMREDAAGHKYGRYTIAR